MLVFVVFEELINQSSDRNNTCIVALFEFMFLKVGQKM